MVSILAEASRHNEMLPARELGLTVMMGSHCRFRRSWTATLTMSSQRSCAGGILSSDSHILATSVPFCTNSRISWAIGLSTGKTPSTNPEPYFQPRPLIAPPACVYHFRANTNAISFWTSNETVNPRKITIIFLINGLGVLDLQDRMKLKGVMALSLTHYLSFWIFSFDRRFLLHHLCQCKHPPFSGSSSHYSYRNSPLHHVRQLLAIRFYTHIVST